VLVKERDAALSKQQEVVEEQRAALVKQQGVIEKQREKLETLQVPFSALYSTSFWLL
jgi:uncharacterized coiled-coil protein SlyX